MSAAAFGAAGHQPVAGELLDGKYRIDRILGIGGMGAVVAARHLALDQLVAIKYLLPEASGHPGVVERFAREARAAARIRGPHAARVIDVGQFADGAPYMVIEHLEGHDLERHLQLHGPLSLQDAVGFVLETCEALAEAHRGRIVHRDLKPANLFLARQPDKRAIIKVLDFGISKLEDERSARLTPSREILGTAYYMSPEQIRSADDVDARADLWALGVILFELLGGQPPFGGDGLHQIMAAVLFEEPLALSVLRPELPAGIAGVIRRCLMKDRNERFASVVDLAVALAPFARPEDRASVALVARVLSSLHPPCVVDAGPASAASDAVAAPTDPGSTLQCLPPATIDMIKRPRPASPHLLAIVVGVMVTIAALALSPSLGVLTLPGSSARAHGMVMTASVTPPPDPSVEHATLVRVAEAASAGPAIDVTAAAPAPVPREAKHGPAADARAARRSASAPAAPAVVHPDERDPVAAPTPTPTEAALVPTSASPPEAEPAAGSLAPTVGTSVRSTLDMGLK